MSEIKIPETFDELLDWIDKRSHQIYVRVFIDNRWHSLSLAEMPARLAITHVCEFIRQGRVPFAVLDEDEVAATKGPDHGST